MYWKIASIVALTSVAAALPAEAVEADAWIGEVIGMIQDGLLLERTVTYTYATIPAIGMPSSTITGWFDQLYDEEDPEYFAEVPLRITHEYRHAGHGATEEYYYTPEGDLVCCVSTVTIYWEGAVTRSDTYYYHTGEFVCCTANGMETDPEFLTDMLMKADMRLRQGESLYDLFMEPPVQPPCIFWEDWYAG
jgi:hypothetical protein